MCYLISLNSLALENIEYDGSFKHIVFVIVFVFVFVFVSVFVIVIADVILFPMMYNMWGLTWFWDDLKAPYWKCGSDYLRTNKQTEFQLVDSTPPAGGVAWKVGHIVSFGPILTFGRAGHLHNCVVWQCHNLWLTSMFHVCQFCGNWMVHCSQYLPVSTEQGDTSDILFDILSNWV